MTAAVAKALLLLLGCDPTCPKWGDWPGDGDWMGHLDAHLTRHTDARVRALLTEAEHGDKRR